MLELTVNKNFLNSIREQVDKNMLWLLGAVLSIISCGGFMFFYLNGLGLSYNDARSHLDIGRRVVEGLKPGLAQLGSVWLPLNHALMIPFIWNDFMWHSGLAGAIISMVSFVITGLIIYKFLEEFKVGLLGRLLGVAIFALNLNVIYLQSTAMTELLLLMTSTAAAYFLMIWAKKDQLLDLIKSAFFVTLAVLTRYDGWFLFAMMVGLIAIRVWWRKGYKEMEGLLILFCTLGGLGIVMWFGWNQLIFKDALYFAFGPYSAHAQQQQLSAAGNLATKGSVFLSTQTYLYALAYNNGLFNLILAVLGGALFWFDKKISRDVRFVSAALSAPLLFNILALYLGFSVLFIQGVYGNTWFNVRYGIMVIPFIAIFIGYLLDKVASLKYVLIGLILLTMVISFTSFDAVTIDDARVGSSQKNVTEVSSWLHRNTSGKDGYILISVASHDATVFSSGLPMSKFIHEGTGLYWDFATKDPKHWARWIVMRTYDNSDETYKLVSQSGELSDYQLVEKYPFADVYQLKDQYLADLITKPVIGKQK